MRPPPQHQWPLLVVILSCLAATSLVLSHDIEEVHDDELDQYPELDFFEEYHEEDPDTGGALKYHARGKVDNRVINVDHHDAIKKVLCEEHRPNVVMVAIDKDEKDIVQPGTILFGGPEHGCPTEVNERKFDGLLRRVVTVEVIRETVIEVTTEGAEFMDLFAHANLKYHYTPGKRNNPKIRHRRKRAAPSSGGLSVARWLSQINYLIDTSADGEALVIDETTDARFISTNEAVPYEYSCVLCQFVLEFGLKFELKKDPDVPDPVTEYSVEIEGNYTLSTNIPIHVQTRLSKNDPFPPTEPSEPKLLTSIPFAFAPEPGLPDVLFNITYDYWYEGHFDSKTKGDFFATVTGMMKGLISLKYSIIGGSRSFPEYSFSNTLLESSSVVTGMVIEGKAEICGAINPVIQLNCQIEWTYRGALHWYDIYNPVQLRIVPHVCHKVKVEDSIVCLETEVSGSFITQNDDVLVDVTLFASGDGYWREDLNANNTVFTNVIMETTQAECGLVSCCVVDCFGPSSKPEEDVDVLDVVGGGDMVPATELMDVKTGSGTDIINNGAQAKFTGKMSLMLLFLAKLAAAYRNSRLILHYGYNVNTAPYNLGRGADVKYSVEDGDAPDGPEVLDKIAQFAVCAGFHYVKVVAGVVKIAVGASGAISPSRDGFNIGLDVIGSGSASVITQAQCDDAIAANRFPVPGVGETSPADSTIHDVCGPVDDPISRMNIERFEQYLHYKWDNLAFEDAEKDHAWCTSNARNCYQCDPASTEPYLHCADRMMNTFTAWALVRFASVLNEAGGSGKVINAWVEPTATVEEYVAPDGSSDDFLPLEFEGRAVTMEVSGVAIGTAAAYATCAGFFFVKVLNSNTLYLGGKKASADGMVYIMYPRRAQLAVDPPTNTDDFDVHESFKDEYRKIQLFDTHNILDQKLARHLTVSDFAYEGARYLRLDPLLVKCIDIVQLNTRVSLKIMKGGGYRTTSANLLNIDQRHPKETYRYTNGQAVNMQSYNEKDYTLADYMVLAKRFLRRCVPIVAASNMGVGVGLHRTFLYVHLFENPERLGKNKVDYWFADELDPSNLPSPQPEGAMTEEEFEGLNRELELYQIQLENPGGPAIAPFSEQNACSRHNLGGGWKGFLQFKTTNDRESCKEAVETDFCKDTKVHRKRVHHMVKDQITQQVQPIPGFDEWFHVGVKNCYETLCGPCQGDGPVWKDKVKYCTDVIEYYYKFSSHEPYLDNFNFFEYDTLLEDMRHEACGGDQEDEEEAAAAAEAAGEPPPPRKLCIPKTSAYTIFWESLAELYRPEPQKDVQEEIYGSGDNPNPISTANDQATAMEVEGHVQVWIDSKESYEKLKSVIRVLFIHNEKVSNITVIFWEMEVADANIIKESLMGSLDVWAGSACPTWSRAAVAPYTTEHRSYPTGRKRRSVRPAEFLRRKRLNWEIEWAMRN